MPAPAPIAAPIAAPSLLSPLPTLLPMIEPATAPMAAPPSALRSTLPVLVHALAKIPTAATARAALMVLPVICQVSLQSLPLTTRGAVRQFHVRRNPAPCAPFAKLNLGHADRRVANTRKWR